MYFENIKGQEFAKKYMINSINKGKINHAYMFEGIEGIGKETFAYDLAKILLETPHLENAPDCIRVKLEGNSIKIAQIRNLQSDIVIKPHKKYKIYIIDKAEKMTLEAQNALLKTLEEPPEYATIILICNNEAQMLTTIKSRCTKINFQKLNENEIKQYFQEIQNEEISNRILKLAEGSIGKAIQIKDKEELYKEVENIINKIEEIKKSQIWNFSEAIYKNVDDISEILDYMNIMFFEKGKIKPQYLNCIGLVENAKRRLKANSNYNMTIDNLLLQIWEEINEKYSRG